MSYSALHKLLSVLQKMLIYYSETVWELKMNDIASKLLYIDNCLYAALANGTLSITEVFYAVLNCFHDSLKLSL